MAYASLHLIEVIKQTATSLESSQLYQWGHMGACNCGFLAQQITKQRKEEIHTKAMERHGDWSEQLNDYCPTSGLLFDDLVSELLANGLSLEDLKHLERLSDPTILRSLPPHERNLVHNKKEDVIKYLKQWAALLEESLLSSIKLPTSGLFSKSEETIDWRVH